MGGQGQRNELSVVGKEKTMNTRVGRMGACLGEERKALLGALVE